VVLSFPFKDCVLEGGQSKDDEKRKEIFFNEVLAKDEINRLLNKKVITSAKKYTQNGVSDKVNFNRKISSINTFKYACSLSSHCTKITPSSLNKSRATSRRFFINEVLAKDEINRLLNKKVITSAKKYTQNGVSDKVTKITPSSLNKSRATSRRFFIN
jgi:adenine specific DNA methylase Mod